MTKTRLTFSFLILCSIYSTNLSAQTVPAIIDKEGYKVEQHFATTKNGYILGLHRITGSKKAAANNATKPAVLLQHGLATSSDCWVLSGRKSALAFQLADKGYDVWLANARGTVYSSNHTKLNMSDPKDIAKFDRYSFHEKGNEDLLTTIDYILANTKQKTLALYAHSEGASMFFALGATQPKELAKINSFYGFAPLVFIGKPISPVFGLVSDYTKPLVSFALKTLSSLSSNIITRSYTTLPITYISGGTEGQFAGGTVSKLYKHFPSRVNKRSLSHLLQLVSSNKFHEYAKLNLKQVVNFGPKKYDLKKVTIPMYLYFSENDFFINVENLNRFDEPFARKPKMFKVNNNFGHYDFVYGKDAYKVYELTYEALKNHTTGLH